MRFRIQTDGDKFRVRWTETSYIPKTIGRDEVVEREMHPYDFGAEAHIRAFGSVPELFFASKDEAKDWIRVNHGTEAVIVKEWRTV